MASPSIINIVSEVTKTTVLAVSEKFKISYQIIYSYLHPEFIAWNMRKARYQ